MSTKVVCTNCTYALLEGAEIPAAWCNGCARNVNVEDAWIAPDEEAEWRISQDHIEALEMGRQDRELDEFVPAQGSAEREPLRQRVNGWPGRKARKVRNG